ncbi:MAG TPA: YceI family protein [Thermomicrobiales bacterium]|nr:YceI family protein [Thermomicrobiales bacterium]
MDTAIATVWKIDQSHSVIEFAVKHMMFATVKGRFTKFEGEIDTEGDFTHGKVSVTIDADSVDTRDAKRDEHLRTNDFFGAGEHPQITFRSTRVEQESGDRFKVYGDLTIRDTTNPVVLEVEFNGSGVNPWGQTVASYSATTRIDREDYGLTWNAALEQGGFLVGNEVKINLELEVVKQEG